MKKIISFTILVVIGLLIVGGPVLALDLGLDSAKNAAAGAGYDAAGTTETTLAETIGSFIRGILTVSGVIFTCLVFYAGYLWMTARGDEAQVEKAKEIIRAGVIGLTIALAAFGITNLVMRMVTGGGASAGVAGAETAGRCGVDDSALQFNCYNKKTSNMCLADSTCAWDDNEPENFKCFHKCLLLGESACISNPDCGWIVEN